MRLTDLKCNGLKNPLGIKSGTVDFGWKICSEERGVYQSAWQIIVKDVKTQEIMWDSGLVKSDCQSAIVYRGAELQSDTQYEWHVLVQDNKGNQAVSETAYFRTGLDEADWQAKWIGCQPEDLDSSVKMAEKEEMVEAFMAMVSGGERKFEPDRRINPCHIYRKFIPAAGKKAVSAYLSITAHGLYEARLNGKLVTETRLNPGFTAYEEYLEYQTYDVSELIEADGNVITITLADGWYRGKYGILGYGNNYGLELAALAQIHICYEDGAEEVIGTDDGFRYRESAYLYSDLLIGEKQDARINMQEIYEKSYDDSAWKQAVVKEYTNENLIGISAEPVRPLEVRAAQEVLTSPKGETIIDFGQVLVGVVRLTATGEAGTEIKLEHSEVLDTEGNFINNISGYNRDQTDYFILAGTGAETFEPAFTFHGFRYVRVSGFPGELKAEDVKAVVLGSDLEETGYFECSDERLTQLQSNIRWSQRGNMLSIPTDCPQRERAGWTGDILVYGKTAGFNQDVKQFLNKWLNNMKIEQFEDGLIPVVIPYPLAYNAMQKEAFGTDTSAGWGDAAVIVPWTLYQLSGDKRMLEDHFDMIKKWMDYVEADAADHLPELEETISEERKERQKYLWNTGFHFGDWCYPSCKNEKGETDMFRSAYTTKEHVATAMYAHSADVMSQICRELGKEDLSRYYAELNQNIRKAFSDEYVREDGSIENAVQGIYILAIAMKMADGVKLERMAEYLAGMIRDNGYKLDTGFLSIEYLMDVLCEYGYKDIAKKVLYQEGCPSWLYEVKQGATTIWETWNAITEDGRPTDNSYNHYVFGCIGDWMYRNLLGLHMTEPGYRKVLIRPDFSFDLTWAKGAYKSIYGLIAIEWKKSGSHVELEVQLPPGTSAVIEIGSKRVETESGQYRMEYDL